VLITGASRGIGYAAAECFAAEGCALRLVSRDSTTLQAAAARLRAEHGEAVEILAMDMRAPGAFTEFLRVDSARTSDYIKQSGIKPQ